MKISTIKDKINAYSPPWLLNAYLSVKNIFRKNAYKELKVIRTSHSINVFHCCVQKTASQWIKAILNDPVIYQYSGLTPISYEDYLKGYNLNSSSVYTFPGDFPEKTIVTPLYLTYGEYESMPKPDFYKSFFVVRDPRDLVVSQYFSKLYSHKRSPEIDAVRRELKALNQEQGILKIIDQLNENGYWDRLRSWGNANDPNLKIVKFEDLTSQKSAYNIFKELFDFCDITLSQEELLKLLNKYSFENLSEGRKKGKENKVSHFRKGISGDWKNYFNKGIEDKFENKAGDLVRLFSY